MRVCNKRRFYKIPSMSDDGGGYKILSVPDIKDDKNTCLSQRISDSHMNWVMWRF